MLPPRKHTTQRHSRLLPPKALHSHPAHAVSSNLTTRTPLWFIPKRTSSAQPGPPTSFPLQENSDLITLNVFDEIIVERAEPVTSRRR